MATKRAHVVLPEELVSQIDRIVGSRGRSFKTEEPIWKEEDHPAMEDGAAKWVRKMRAESEARFQQIQRHRDRDY